MVAGGLDVRGGRAREVRRSQPPQAQLLKQRMPPLALGAGSPVPDDGDEPARPDGLVDGRQDLRPVHPVERVRDRHAVEQPRVLRQGRRLGGIGVLPSNRPDAACLGPVATGRQHLLGHVDRSDRGSAFGQVEGQGPRPASEVEDARPDRRPAPLIREVVDDGRGVRAAIGHVRRTARSEDAAGVRVAGLRALDVLGHNNLRGWRCVAGRLRWVP